MNPLHQLDNLDDRTEIITLLSRLSPKNRVLFLTWCGTQCTPKQRVMIEKMRSRLDGAYRCDRHDTALTNEIYCDFLVMSCQHKLDPLHAVRVLERFVRNPASLPSSAASPPSPVAPHTSCTPGCG